MIEPLILHYLINALWQLPLLCVAAWLLLRLTGPAPRLCYHLWLCTLLVGVLLPLHNSGLPNAPQAISPVALPADSVHPPVTSVVLLPSSPTPGTFATSSTQLPSSPHHWLSAHPLRFTPHTMHLLLAFYALISLVGFLRIARSWLKSRALVAASTSIDIPEAHRALWHRTCRNLHLDPPALGQSYSIASPVLAGIVHPSLLVPAGFFMRSTPGEIDAAMLHELAHLRQRDCLVNLSVQLIAVPVLWHPVAHLVLRRIGSTREMVSDSIAAGLMPSPLTYAHALVSLAAGILALREPLPALTTIGLFNTANPTTDLEERIMQIVTSKPKPTLAGRTLRATVAAVALVATTALVATFQLTPIQAAAQAAQAAPTAPTTSAAQATSASSATSAATPPAGAASSHSAPSPAQATHRHQSNTSQAKPLVIATDANLTPEQQRAIDARMKDAEAKLEAATAQLNSPAFQQQMDQIQQQLDRKLSALDADRQKALEAQMERAGKQIEAATAKINSPAFQKQMEEMERAITEKQLANAQLMADHAAALASKQIDSAEMQKKIADASAAIERAGQQMEQMGREMQQSAEQQRGNSQPSPTPK